MDSINEAFWRVSLGENIPSSTMIRNHHTNLPDLPIEIRLRIIHFTLTGGNVVIDMNSSSFPKRVSPTPVALRLNQEFRAEALKHYQLLGHCGRLLFMEKPKMWIYFNHETDHITFSKDSEGMLRKGSVKFITNTIPEARRAELTVVLTDISCDEMLDIIIPKTGKGLQYWKTSSKLLNKGVGEVVVLAKGKDMYGGFEYTLKEMLESEEFLSFRRSQMNPFGYLSMARGVYFAGIKRLDGGLGVVLRKRLGV